ncbi:hypothetical protein ENBRE01_3278 [Enteropsectra breve]|nr:hypothetical protein ENBRE01_3278 [Enteropsectra breve]
MLEEASIIKIKQGIDVSHLMRQVNSRSPAGIKSILLQCLFSKESWVGFLGTAQKSAWVAFPEKVIGHISTEEGNKSYSAPSRQWHCPYYGEGDHSAKFCPVIKKLESKGWVRNKLLQRRFIRDIKNEEDEYHVNPANKNDLQYFCKNVRNNSSCFLKNTKLKGSDIKVLVDTGADVSLIPKELTKELRGEISKYKCRTPPLTYAFSDLSCYLPS